MSKARRLLGLASSLQLLACSGAGGKAVEPAPPTYQGAVGGAGSCEKVGGFGAPLVVDWKPEQRGDLEVVLREGIPAVRYDCSHLDVLDCRAVGTYGFLPVTRKEQIVRLETADEIRANLPLGGAKLAGALETGASLDIALVMVGKRSTTVMNVARNELRGRCDGATHFVRRVTVGAFAMRVGTRGSVRSAADLFGVGAEAGSSSKKTIENRDGQLSSCNKASTSSTEPPDQCGSLIRLELVALDPAGQKLGPDDPVRPPDIVQCPTGMVATEGKCTAPSQTASSTCDGKDGSACDKQCNAGSAQSCVLLGRLLELGQGGVAKDEKRAGGLFDKGCAAGDADGCTRYAFHVLAGSSSAEASKKSFGLFEKACDAGDPAACHELAKEYEGQFKGTLRLALPWDPRKALGYYERGCNGGYNMSCTSLARLYDRGEPPVGKDPERALEYHVRACEAGQCADIAGIYQRKTDPRYDKRVLGGYERGCRSNSNYCIKAADFYERGVGTAKDIDRAIAMYLAACWDQNGAGCQQAERLAASSPRVLASVKAECSGGHKWACMELARMHEQGFGTKPDKGKAADIYKGLCDASAPADIRNIGFVACDALKRLKQ